MLTCAPRCDMTVVARESGISLFEVNKPQTMKSQDFRVSISECAPATEALSLRMPRADDGPRVHSLIASSPPLDVNSPYCNLLQCTDFRETCILADRGDALLGWVSAYRPPRSPDELFIWQVAIACAARGEGLALKMLDALLERSAVAGVRALVTTITEDNEASWGLFRSFARRHGATLTKSPRFERQAHFGGAHDTEWEARIAPLPALSK